MFNIGDKVQANRAWIKQDHPYTGTFADRYLGQHGAHSTGRIEGEEKYTPEVGAVFPKNTRMYKVLPTGADKLQITIFYSFELELVEPATVIKPPKISNIVVKHGEITEE